MSLSQNQILILKKKKNQPVQLIAPVKGMKHFRMETMIHELHLPTGDETIWAFLSDAYITGNIFKNFITERKFQPSIFLLERVQWLLWYSVSLGECVCAHTHTKNCVS